MKKIFLLFSLFAILTSCGKPEDQVYTIPPEVPKYVTTQIVEPKVFSEHIKLSGKVSSSKETSVAPQMAGTIKSISVNVGDRVKAGQVLATIDTQSNLTNVQANNAQNQYNNTLQVYNATKESLQKNLEASELQLANARTSRDNTYATTAKQLELAQAQLEAVLTQETNTEKSTESNLSLLQKSIDTAQLNLENFYTTKDESLRSLEAKKENIVKSMKVTIDSAMISFVSIFDFADPVLGISDQNKNTAREYESYLGFRNATLKNQVMMDFSVYKNEYLRIKGQYDGWVDVMTFHNDIALLIDKLVTFTDNLYQVFEDSTDGDKLTPAQLSGRKATVKQYQGQIVSMKGSFVQISNSMADLESSITTTKIQLDTQEKTLQQAIETARANLANTQTTLNNSKDTINQQKTTAQIQVENTIASIQSQRDAADNAVKVAETQYKSAQANRDSQLASIQSQLDAASGNRNSLNQQIANASIKAPFDGVITAKSVEVGSAASPGVRAFSLATNSDKIVKMDISSDNVKYLSEGMEVEIRKNQQSSKWRVSLVPKTANETNNLFAIEIVFSDKDFENSMIIGDFVDVYIHKNIGSEMVLTVPFSALNVLQNETYSVFVVGEDSRVREKEVKRGASNSSEYVITSGLSAGDRVVVKGMLLISHGDLVAETPEETPFFSQEPPLDDTDQPAENIEE